jgi:hypothetical protein
MDKTLPGLLRSSKSARRQAVHRFKFSGPTVLARLNVPIEGSNFRDSLSEPQSLLVLSEQTLSVLSLSDVAKHKDTANHLACLAANRSGTVVNWPFTAVPCDEYRVVSKSHDNTLP